MNFLLALSTAIFLWFLVFCSIIRGPDQNISDNCKEIEGRVISKSEKVQVILNPGETAYLCGSEVIWVK